MFCEPNSLRLNVPLPVMRVEKSDINEPEDFRTKIIFFA